jgi:hypothetical protein
VVAANMQLTESEAKAFWPVYEEYQKDLAAINQRIGNLIKSYAADYNANTLTDEKAKKLVDELVAIEQAEAGLKSSYVPKLGKVLPMKKVARYLQVENKVRALVSSLLGPFLWFADPWQGRAENLGKNTESWGMLARRKNNYVFPR